MQTPLLLNDKNVINVPQTPGAFLLGSDKKIVFIGRADKNLQNEISKYLPNSEKFEIVERFNPNHFWYICTRSPDDAYHLELNLKVIYRPSINFLHEVERK